MYDRDCDVTIKCYTDEMTEEEAKVIISKLEKLIENDLNKTYNKACADIEFNGNDKGYGILEMAVDYTEECDVEEGRTSFNWYEPDEPTNIEADDEDDIPSIVQDSINKAFNEINMDCYDNDLVENRSEKLEDLYEQVDSRSYTNDDYYR